MIHPNHPRNWKQDYKKEMYENTCRVCGEHFLGYKRRVVCRACVIPGHIKSALQEATGKDKIGPGPWPVIYEDLYGEQIGILEWDGQGLKQRGSETIYIGWGLLKSKPQSNK